MKYNILLVLSDGSVIRDDFRAVKEQIIEASKLPISIIIIGVGVPDDDFRYMKKLDADKEPLTFKAKDDKDAKRIYQTRDCVQFIPMYDMKDDVEKITVELLREIPD